MSDKNIIQNQIDLAKNNNQNAFSFLLNMFWDDVYNFQLKRTKNEIEAEDITIESFLPPYIRDIYGLKLSNIIILTARIK